MTQLVGAAPSMDEIDGDVVMHSYDSSVALARPSLYEDDFSSSKATLKFAAVVERYSVVLQGKLQPSETRFLAEPSLGIFEN